MQAQSEHTTASPQEIRSFMAGRGFISCDTRADAEALRALAQALIPVAVASADTLARVQMKTSHSLYLKRENGAPVSFVAFFPFSAAGERAVLSPGFRGGDICLEWVAPFDAATRAGYVWGLGGSSRSAGFAAMRALRIMRERFFAHVGLYARPATEAGRRLMAAFGYAPAWGADRELHYSPPCARSREQAA